MKKSDRLIIMCTLAILDIIFLWCIDVSVSGIITNGYMTNGFFNNSPMISYHIGLYGIIASLFIWCLLYIDTIVKDK